MGCLVQWLLRTVVSILIYALLAIAAILIIFRWVRWIPPPVVTHFLVGQKILWQWKEPSTLPAVKNETLAAQELVRYNFFGGEKDRLIDVGVFLIAQLIKVLWGPERIQVIYWNSVPWGKEVWGMGAAAQVYLRKPLETLTTEEMCQLLYLRRYVEKAHANSEILPWAKRKAQVACRSHAF
ncbi:MAG: transglycosylase domain-containing protein [Bacteroidia bacterium]